MVEHFKQERDNFVTINDIFRYNNFHMMFINIGERRHFHTLNRLKKVQILISKYFEKSSISHVSIVVHYNKEKNNFATMNDIPKYSNFLTTAPNLGKRRHFDSLNILKKVQILILKCFGNLSFCHASMVEHLKQEKDNFVTVNDISKYTNLLMTIQILGER